MSALTSKLVTMSDDSELARILALGKQQREQRAFHLPTTAHCVVASLQARERLFELGWKDGTYAPKDRPFSALVHGASGVHRCQWLGGSEGAFFLEDTNDFWPATILVWCEIDAVIP